MLERLRTRITTSVGRGRIGRDTAVASAASDTRSAHPAIERARARLRRGDLDGALAEIREDAATGPGATRLLRLAESIESTRRATTPGWLPSLAPVIGAAPAHADVEGTSSPSGAPIPGRVLMLVTDAVPYREGGFALRTHAVAQAQRTAGLDPQVVTSPGEPRDPLAPAERIVDGVHYHTLAPGADPLPLDRSLERHLRLAADVAARLRPSVIHTAESATMTGPTAQVGLALARACDVPMMFEVRGFREESWLARQGADLESSQRYRLTRDCDTWLMQAAEAVVTLNETMRREMVARGVPDERITIVPNAVDVQRFLPRPPDAELIERLGIRDGQVVIGYVGGLQPYEGLTTLVSAVAALVARGRDVRLLLVGEGPSADAIAECAAASGIEDRVTFAGRVAHADIPRWYSVLDIVSNARTDDRVSRLVGPTKPLEALAMERALVVSRTPALMECVVEDQTGLVVTPDSVDALAETLDLLVCDTELRARLGSAGRRWAISERSWAANGLAYRRLFERLGAL